MLIAKKVSVLELQETEEEDEFLIQNPAGTAKAIFGFEDFSNAVNSRMLSKNNISLVKRPTSNIFKGDQTSLSVLERSMAANGFPMTEYILPVAPEQKLGLEGPKNFTLGKLLQPNKLVYRYFVLIHDGIGRFSQRTTDLEPECLPSTHKDLLEYTRISNLGDTSSSL